MATGVLFVASTGGHLEQLKRLRDTVVSPLDEVTWVTFDSAQSRSLLADEADVRFIGEVAPRAFGALLRSVVPALLLLVRLRPRAVYSTGAGIALAFLPFAWLVGARAVYYESATRTEGPSVTGRLLTLAPWVHLRTRYRSWSSRRWLYGGSAFDVWRPARRETVPAPVRRIVVFAGDAAGLPSSAWCAGCDRSSRPRSRSAGSSVAGSPTPIGPTAPGTTCPPPNCESGCGRPMS